MTLKRPEETIIRNDAELMQLWCDLMGEGGFASRRLWHAFLAPNGEIRPLVVPIDDVPDEPDDQLLRNVATVMHDASQQFDGATVAVLLSRPGSVDMTDSDRRWARALRAALGPELSPWPIHLATCGRVQVFAGDDLI